MEFDLHIHTNRYSGCSNIDPRDALTRAVEVGLDGIALTEHGIRWKDGEIDELLRETGVTGLVVIPGQEVACYSREGRSQGEFLVYGYPESLGSNKSVETVIEMVHAAGGVVIAAHPFKPHDSGYGFYGSGHSIFDYDVDGIEVDHPSYDRVGRELAIELLEKKNYTGIACSDAHDVRSIGTLRTIFDVPIKDTEDLCRELLAGRVRTQRTVKGSGNFCNDR